ncbi:glycosyltransferase family 4 protein [Patescibacteria group bacterium]|nr:glycosyltransferase family 4 protein [Patescibacteria group bacterium]
MKVAIVRGDFASPFELGGMRYLQKGNRLELVTGLMPVSDLSSLSFMDFVKLPCPVDLNFGRIDRGKMAVLNRIFVDAHVLFGLENKLKNLDIAFCAETYYFYSYQCIKAKNLGYVKKVISLVFENIPFNNEGIWGRRRLKQYVIKNTDRFIAVTDRARDVLIEEGADPKKIVRLNPGVDLSIFRPQVESRIMNHELGKKPIRLLTVGRLVPEKGIREMVAAFKKLHKEFPALEFTVVGSGPLESLLNVPGITHLEKVKFEDMPKIYNSADIYIHYPVGSKTWLEQFGFVLTEAMACGLPVVALNKGSVGEVVGEGGILVENRKQFEEVLERLIKNKQQRRILGKKSLNFARKNYDVKKYSAGILKVFKEVLHENHRRHR